jgi:hypothetical protein
MLRHEKMGGLVYWTNSVPAAVAMTVALVAQIKGPVSPRAPSAGLVSTIRGVIPSMSATSAHSGARTVVTTSMELARFPKMLMSLCWVRSQGERTWMSGG